MQDAAKKQDVKITGVEPKPGSGTITFLGRRTP